MTIIDLSECDIIHNMDQDPDTIPDDTDQQVIPHLTKEKLVIVLAAESPQAEQHELTDAHFDSKILTRIRLHDDKDTWTVPLSTLTGPCFAVYNKNYTKTTNDNLHMDDRASYIVEPMAKWRDVFLPIPDG